MDNYERLRMLGKGSYGKAWLVQEKTSKQNFVIKEIHVQNHKEMDEALAEAEVLSKLHHINIIRYSKLIRVSAKVVCIVMEFADDGDMADKIGRRKITSQLFDEPFILANLAQIVQALYYLHTRGILHRDIKTANLFMNKSGILKVGDFGIAKILEDNAERISARTCRTPVGTPLYMSPELCTGESYGQKADMWALGCVLYEMCALKPAFVATSLDSLMAKIKRGQREQKISTTYSEELRGLIGKLLNIDSRVRPSAREILMMPFLQPYIAQAPDTLAGTYTPPSGSTPFIQPRVVEPRHPPSSTPSLQVKDQSRPDIMVVHHTPSAFLKLNKHLSVDNRSQSLEKLDFNPNTPLPEVGRWDSVPVLNVIPELSTGLIDQLSDLDYVASPSDGHHGRRARADSDPMRLREKGRSSPAVASPLQRGISLQDDDHQRARHSNSVSPVPSSHHQPHARQNRLSLPQLDEGLQQYRMQSKLSPPSPVPVSRSQQSSPSVPRKSGSHVDVRRGSDVDLRRHSEADVLHGHVHNGRRPRTKDLQELAEFYRQANHGGIHKPPGSAPASGQYARGKLPSLY